jgi:hypothetical protein
MLKSFNFSSSIILIIIIIDGENMLYICFFFSFGSCVIFFSFVDFFSVAFAKRYMCDKLNSRI